MYVGRYLSLVYILVLKQPCKLVNELWFKRYVYKQNIHTCQNSCTKDEEEMYKKY